MKTYGEVRVWLHSFLTWAVDGVEWSAAYPDRYTPRERAPSSHWIGGWMGPTTSLDVVEKRKISFPCQLLWLNISSQYKDYQLDNWGFGVWFSARASDFSIVHSIQSKSGALWASYSVNTGLKVTAHPHVMLKLRIYGAIPPLPLTASWHGTQLSTGTTSP
jgi:hypothetical protein